MAARENQGLQAIVITLTILVLILGVSLALVNNARKTQNARADSAEQQRDQARSDQAKDQAQATTYKEWIGFGEGDAYEALEERFKEDMGKYGANVDEESRKYRTLLDTIFEENRKLVQNEATAKQQVIDLKNRLAAVEAQKEAQVKEFQTAMQKAGADLAQEKTKFDEYRARLQAEKEQLDADLKQIQQAHDEAVAKSRTSQTELETTIAKLERSIDKYKTQLPEADKFAQPADGRITWVDQNSKTVWIDLGSSDGIRPQVTFSVLPAGGGDAQEAQGKGAIEVTRITGEHMAEATITEDSNIDPLVPGDRIYSVVWDRGRKVGFAIAGRIDIDGDRRSDLEQLKNIIAANNGRVDAAPDASGKKQGELQVDTRYLILGEFPTGNPDERLTWNALSEEAETLGVDTIPLAEFLSLVGWRTEGRSVPLGTAARARDFPAVPAGESRPQRLQQPTGAFERRLPPVSY